MSKVSKSIINLAILLILICLIVGCESPIKSRGEIKDLYYTSTIGVDKSSTIEDGVKLSYLFDIPTQESKAELSDRFITSEGKTVFVAKSNMKTVVSGDFCSGSPNYFIIGENVAKESLNKCIDYQTKDNQSRLNIKVFVTQGTTAHEIITSAESDERTIKDVLLGLEANIGGKSVTNTVDLLQLMKDINNENKSPVIPVLKVSEVIPGTSTSWNNTQVELSGYGVFKDDKLIGYLNEDQSTGLNWVKGDIKSNLYVIEGVNYGKVSLEIIQSKASINPEKVKDGMTVDFNIQAYTTLGEQFEQKNIYTAKLIKEMEKDIEEKIYLEIQSVVDYAMDNQVDIFGICDKVYHKYPIEWETMKDNWELKINSLDIKVTVDVNIRRTHDFKEPLGI